MFDRYETAKFVLPYAATRVLLLSGLLLWGLLQPSVGYAQSAKVVGPQRAIERLEGCSQQEKKRNCVRILKRRNAADGIVEIKAEIRHARII